MQKREKILIVGGEGFIGRNLADTLSKNYACFSLGKKKSPFAKRKDTFIKVDPYRKKVKNVYDVIIHLIDNKVDTEYFVQEEEKLIQNIGLNEKNHVIVFSSAVVYADARSPYGQRKTKLEKIYTDYCRKNKIHLTIFRLFNVFGPYQLPGVQGSLVANIFCNYLNSKETEIYDMGARRDFIFSKDVAAFVAYAIKNRYYGRADIASGKLTTVGALLRKIQRTVGGAVAIHDQKGKDKSICPSAETAIIKKINVTPMQRGLEETWGFYCQTKRVK